jgi:hypothetical protein
MALSLSSPGITVREVDLTRGSVNTTTSLSAGIAAPFQKGPVQEVVEIYNENDLKNVFGKPSKNDNHYEYWYSASNFLSYGGSLKVVRSDSTTLKNSNAGVGASSTSIKIKNYDNYQSSTSTGAYWIAKNPGYWADGIKVCVIDNFADQTIGITTSGLSVGYAVTQTVDATEYLKGIITGIGNSEIYVKVTNKVGSSGTSIQDYTENGKYSFNTSNNLYINGALGVGATAVTVTRAGLSTYAAATVSIGNSFSLLNYKSSTTIDLAAGEIFASSDNVVPLASVAGISSGTVLLIGSELFSVYGSPAGNIVTLRNAGVSYNRFGTTQVNHSDNEVVKVFDRYQNYVNATAVSLSASTTISLSGITSITSSDYLINQASNEIMLVNSVSNAGILTPTSISDWYNSQYILSVANGDISNVLWKSFAPKPKTNEYVSNRGGGNDALHIAVIDNSKGSNNDSTNPQERIETFLNLSKASDAQISPSQKIYYKDYLALNSQILYAGELIGTDSYWSVSPAASKFSSENTAQSTSLGIWGQSASGVYFNVIGNESFTLTGGKDYSTASGQPTNVGGFSADISDIQVAYNYLSNPNEVSLNFILQGGASGALEFEQTKANYIINIAETRKDCLAVISPCRSAIVNVSTEAQKLQNVLQFFTPLNSSSYAIFDSGYQYFYDRFNKEFYYMPCSSDVAGLCVRTDINQFPWYSPAGKVRGSLNNVIKLAYNPSQTDRDSLYSNRINPIINSAGSGTILFGDKTALSYTSAFDRINVRRLFITIEQAIKSSADAQLFEFNDPTTRANFINVVEPYLRDVQAKRGITDFLLVCDETNNTPAVIDRNEFIADIYVKPARSINFIGLTFIATRTGVSFQSIVGTI